MRQKIRVGHNGQDFVFERMTEDGQKIGDITIDETLDEIERMVGLLREAQTRPRDQSYIDLINTTTNFTSVLRYR